jgi:non-ribosomal peptide synthetase component F
VTGSACLHELIEAQVAMRPDVVAVRCGGRALTYARLNDRANQVACALRALGVTAESPVGLVADRSVDAVAGLLGVLKAGGAYVPLDPAHPARRLAFLGADAGVVAVVGAGSHAGVAAGGGPGAGRAPAPPPDGGGV